MDTPSGRRYYEQNTQLFLRFVRTTGTYTIHRAVWAEGVHSQTEALNYSNELLTQELAVLVKQQSLKQLRILDLGCGVGGSVLSVDTLVAHFDAIYSIEAFAHATHPEKYFDEVARLLKPSGKLILCDDFFRSDI